MPFSSGRRLLDAPLMLLALFQNFAPLSERVAHSTRPCADTECACISSARHSLRLATKTRRVAQRPTLDDKWQVVQVFDL